MTATDELLARAEAYASAFGTGDLPAPPAKRVAIVACMDARLDLYGLFGLREGDAHVIRNAGGAVTDDAVRSLAISQRVLGTVEVILVHHTGCGMLGFADGAFSRQVEAETGIRPPWAAEAFTDLEQDVRQCMARVHASPFLPEKGSVRGFVFEVETGRLREVTP